MGIRTPTPLEYAILCALRLGSSGTSIDELHGRLLTAGAPLADAGLQISHGSLHPTLTRMESMQWLSSSLSGKTPARGGRVARIYRLTPAGELQLRKSVQYFTELVNFHHATA